ncbi:hypothetical protein WA158_007130 [Blastocystis sp. Blastoise]
MGKKKPKVVEFQDDPTQDFFDLHSTNQNKESLKEQRENLPIFEYKQQILDAIQTHQVLILLGETGSGKTTQVSQYLYEEGLLGTKRIGITQPRRVAAITVAKRVSEEQGVRLGDEVGYNVRFDDHTNIKTKIKFLTDGMLLREAMVDNMLTEYSVIVIDEVHERSLQSDILCAFIKTILSKRSDLKLILMSATLNTNVFLNYFPDASTLYIHGRQHPVEVYYTPTPEADYIDAALITILQLHLYAPAGDVLVFLTGQEDIEVLLSLLEERVKLLPPEQQNLVVYPLYSQLPPEQQLVVFLPLKDNQRKVVLSTNIAESSITLNGIRYVVDTGLVKIRVEQGITGYDSLLIVPVSKQQAWQRTGRAGREAEGFCYRLYPETSFLSLTDQSVPEIKRTSLSSTLLQLKMLGIDDVFSFPYLESPPLSTIKTGLQTLILLGAIDKTTGKITEEGRQMSQLPLEPIYSKLILTARKYNCTSEILDIVSLLSVDNIFYIPREKKELAAKKKEQFISVYGDHLTLLNVLKQYREVHEDTDWCKENYINIKSMKMSCENDTDSIRRCMVAAMYIQIARKLPQLVKGARCEYKTILGSKVASLHPGSVLFMKTPPPETIIYTDLVLTSKQYFRAVTIIESQWITELVPQWFQSQKSHNL